ncbi:MAG: DUF3800 domain-containing protein [Patescibacteria group bacterium]|nr:DUF3800 domain-containing protein [Patescibacteria group bacterium]
MYLMYIDESGRPGLSKKDLRHHLALISVLIKDSDWNRIIFDFNKIKLDIFGRIDIEFKSNLIRRRESPFDILSDEAYQNLMNRLETFFKDASLTLIAAVINIDALISKYTQPADPYELAYQFILERGNRMMIENNNYGFIILDSKSGQLGIDVDTQDHKLIVLTNILRKKTTRILGDISFGDSRYITGLQIADLAVYPFYHRFEYNKPDYITYRLMENKLRKGPRGEIEGFGLKYFPK